MKGSSKRIKPRKSIVRQRKMPECDFCGDPNPEYTDGKRYLCEPCIERQDLWGVIKKEKWSKAKKKGQ